MNMKTLTVVLGLALVGCSGCVGSNPVASVESGPAVTFYVSIYGDTLKLADDGTYLVKSPGSNLWLGGSWSRNASMFCGVPGIFSGATTLPSCGGFMDPNVPGRLQDPTSIFFWDQVSRWWEQP